MKYVIYSALVLAMFSCKKKNEDETINTNTPTAAQLAGTYKQTSQKFNGVEVFNSSSGFYDACQLDDTYTLNTNGTAVYHDAGTVCNPSGDDSSTWSVSGNRFTLDTETLTIVNFNGTTLQLNTTETVNGSTFNTDITLVKQ
ncbi:lipocalin family protein [Flaviaesturariibacter terrae]